MVSLPSRTRLPGLCLLLMGISLCVIGASGAATPSAPSSYSVEGTHTVHEYDTLSPDAQQLIDNGSESSAGAVTVTELPSEFRPEEWNFVRTDQGYLCVFFESSEDGYTLTDLNCTGIAFDVQTLSDRGQAYFTMALDNPDKRVIIRQDRPRDFSFGAGDNPPGPPDRGESDTGYYYIFKNGTAYGFVATGMYGFAGLGNTIGEILFLAGGVGVAFFGVSSYTYSWGRAPLPFIAGTTVLILWSLLRVLFTTFDEYQWVYWLNHQSPLLVAAVVAVLAWIGVRLSSNREPGRRTAK